jgi:hypothetical protein
MNSCSFPSWGGCASNKRNHQALDVAREVLLYIFRSFPISFSYVNQEIIGQAWVCVSGVCLLYQLLDMVYHDIKF